MKSIAFPKMLGNTYTYILSDYDATLNNLKLLIASDRYALLGDPYYGTNIKRMLQDQNSPVLKDLVIDDIFDAIVSFMPQIKVSRNDIKVVQKSNNVYIQIKATNMVDFVTNLYEINLTSTDEQGGIG